MNTEKTLLLDALAAQNALYFVISVLTDEQKEKLTSMVNGYVNQPSPDTIGADESDMLKELKTKVAGIIHTGTTKFD